MRTILASSCLLILAVGCNASNPSTNDGSTPVAQGGGAAPASTNTVSTGGNSAPTTGSSGGATSPASTNTVATGGNSSNTSGGSSATTGGATSSAAGGSTSGGTSSTTGGTSQNSSAQGGGTGGSSNGQGGTAEGIGGSATGGGTTTGGTATGGSTAAGNAPADSPVAKHGQLKVVGSQLVDASGSPVQLKGPSSMWLNWESQKFAEDKQGLAFMRDDWGASLVRAAMGIDTTDLRDNDYLTAPDIAKGQVNQIVQNAIDLGMYVIIDWHDGSADTRLSQATAFFTEMATKWGSYPNVIYETFNEPTKQAWSTVLKPYHEAVVAAIRAVDPDNVIVLGTGNYSQYVDEPAADPLTRSTNLMYTLHFYSCTHTQKLRDTAIAALTAGLPLFVTEWGATNADGGTPRNPQLCLDEAQLWHDWMNENKISWAAWKWDRCADQTCYFSPDSTISTTGPWTDAMLNGHASFVRDRMRE